MAGPNLELFKFSLYLFFPLAIMVHYGDPQWYHDHVLPIRDQFWPDERTLYKPPRNSADLKASLEEMRKERLAKRDEREGRARASTSTATPSSSSSSSNSGAGAGAAPNLREGGALGKFYEARETNRTGPTWRETWVEATQRKVV
ncbi:hypothetical protein FA10DRAFT_266432 [Acaromyces ingoldii]|uniref:Uncharacterized protein n=1 Tax=Acaromyces ingoldii TaxID=215250 RepID=A0A316YL09_9BASI|nr:hypothetical protein FA10DRAFT_266432 [Acaromyces ingoldii]PWN89892.1 hypothetical protein FA10DRAFT_266432 [Acaromyces ingoldii]